MLKNIYLEAISNNKIGYLRYFLHNLKTFLLAQQHLQGQVMNIVMGKKIFKMFL